MRYFLTKFFSGRLRDCDLTEEPLKEVLVDIALGRSISLGQSLYKIRFAAEGSGKSGGFRIIFLWKRESFIVFLQLFRKNDRENLSFREIKALYYLSSQYRALTQGDIQNLITIGEWKELAHD